MACLTRVCLSRRRLSLIQSNIKNNKTGESPPKNQKPKNHKNFWLPAQPWYQFKLTTLVPFWCQFKLPWYPFKLPWYQFQTALLPIQTALVPVSNRFGTSSNRLGTSSNHFGTQFKLPWYPHGSIRLPEKKS